MGRREGEREREREERREERKCGDDGEDSNQRPDVGGKLREIGKSLGK